MPVSPKLFANKKITLTLMLISLTALCIVVIKPVWASGDSWALKAPMHEARAHLGVTVANGKIYAIGGSTESGQWTISNGFIGTVTGGFVGTNEEYDPATDTWTLKKPMPTPRAGFAIAAYQNKIYCIGGLTSNGSVTGVNEIYDPATDMWETKAPMPAATWQVKANVVNGKIYVIDYSGTNYVYDPASDSWTIKAKAPMTIWGTDYVSAVVDGKIYVIGGISKSQDFILNQIYDAEADKWSLGAPPPSSVGVGGGGVGAAGATTGEMAPKRIYVLANIAYFIENKPPDSNRIYDPASDSWTFGASMPTIRVNFGVAVVNDTLYAIGGGRSDNAIIGFFTPSAVNEQYTPIGYGTISQPSLSTSPSPSASQQPTQSPQPQPELVYATAASAAAITIVAVTAVVLKKRHQKNTS